jgi:hypothetical protein
LIKLVQFASETIVGIEVESRWRKLHSRTHTVQEHIHCFILQAASKTTCTATLITSATTGILSCTLR